MYSTINLLPPHKKQLLHAGRIVTYAEASAVFFLILGGLFMGTFLAILLLLKGVEDTLLAQSTQMVSDAESPKNEVVEIDKYLKHIDSIQSGFVTWSHVLEGVARATPEGIRFEQLGVNITGKIIIRGIAPTRSEVLEFQNALEDLEYFTEVSSPLSNILQKTNVSFSFEATYSKPTGEQEEL